MSQHTFSRIALAALVTLAGASQAQTVVDLQYSGNTCSFTTNSVGVTYDSGSGHLIAGATDATAFSGTCPGQAQNPTFSRGLAASPVTPALNQAFTLSWATTNADYCKTDGTSMPAGVSLANWPLSGNICSTASACASPSVNATVTASGAYTFALQCFKNGNSTPATSQVTLTFTDGGGGGTCDANPPVVPTRQNTPTVKFGGKTGTFLESTHDQVFNDDPSTSVEAFPQVGNRAVTMIANAGQYIALPFTVPANLTTAAGRWGFFDTNYLGSPAFPASGGASYSVSQCPGDFNVPAQCKQQWNGADGNYLTWAGPNVSDPQNQLCKLTPGKTYYLNIITATLAAPTTSACVNSTCSVSMSYFRVQ